jgi:transposase-like protein
MTKYLRFGYGSIMKGRYKCKNCGRKSDSKDFCSSGCQLEYLSKMKNENEVRI